MKKINNYELTYVVADVSAEQANKVHEEVKAVLAKRETELTTSEEWGHRKLFHEARHNQRGHFYFCTFKALPDVISTITSDLHVMSDVIKFMVSRVKG